MTSFYNLLPIDWLISKHDNRELIITNKRAILIEKNKGTYYFYFYDSDFYTKDQDYDVYAKVEKNDTGKHLLFEELKFRNVSDDVDLEGILEYIEDQIKKLYLNAR